MAEQLELFGNAPRARELSADSDYTIYTDGSCLRNPGGPGAWCAIVLRDGEQVEVRRASERSTTNNRMELRAAIYGLLVLPKGSRCTVITDSQYVQKGAMFWWRAWKRKHWRNVKNLDLWTQLLAAKDERRCVFKWVRGHNGDKWNERCDELAGECVRALQSEDTESAAF